MKPIWGTGGKPRVSSGGWRREQDPDLGLFIHSLMVPRKGDGGKIGVRRSKTLF